MRWFELPLRAHFRARAARIPKVTPLPPLPSRLLRQLMLLFLKFVVFPSAVAALALVILHPLVRGGTTAANPNAPGGQIEASAAGAAGLEDDW